MIKVISVGTVKKATDQVNGRLADTRANNETTTKGTLLVCLPVV